MIWCESLPVHLEREQGVGIVRLEMIEIRPRIAAVRLERLDARARVRGRAGHREQIAHPDAGPSL